MSARRTAAVTSGSGESSEAAAARPVVSEETILAAKTMTEEDEQKREEKPVFAFVSPGVQIGDVVLYADSRTRDGYRFSPAVVLTVEEDGTADLKVLRHHGDETILGASEGEGLNTWRYRD